MTFIEAGTDGDPFADLQIEIASPVDLRATDFLF